MKSKAVFFDRDGVINHERGIDYTYQISHFKFYKEVFSALAKLNSDFKKIIVTNQAGIAKGIYSEKDYQELTNYYLKELEKRELKIDKVYHCPHKDGCQCRKPQPGMLLEAAQEFNLDLRKSWLIGDKSSDILAGQKVGCRTILMETGHGGADQLHQIKADHQAKDLNEAIEIINKN